MRPYPAGPLSYAILYGIPCYGKREAVDRLFAVPYLAADMTPIGLRVRELREQRGWSQAELCRQSGVRQATLSAIENNRTKGVDFETLEKLAVALEVHPAALIEKKDE
jgi:DNA-binding Xre family transcriptional regulator